MLVLLHDQAKQLKDLIEICEKEILQIRSVNLDLSDEVYEMSKDRYNAVRTHKVAIQVKKHGFPAALKKLFPDHLQAFLDSWTWNPPKPGSLRRL